MFVFTYLKQIELYTETLLIRKSFLGEACWIRILKNWIWKHFPTRLKHVSKDWINSLKTNERIPLEDVQDLEQLITADSTLMEKAIYCRGELEIFLSLLLNVSRPTYVFSSTTVTDKRIKQMQTQMQQRQPIHQHLLRVQTLTTLSNFPNWTLPYLTGWHRMKWKEFWDRF